MGVIELGKIPPIKRFRSEDYPTIPANFLNNLSIAVETIINTLDNFVNFDNMAAQVWERIAINTNDPQISATSPLRLAWNRKYYPATLSIGGVWLKNADLNTAPLGVAVTVEWDFDSTQKQIVIRGLNGLPTTGSPAKYGADYQITFFSFCR